MRHFADDVTFPPGLCLAASSKAAFAGQSPYPAVNPGCEDAARMWLQYDMPKVRSQATLGAKAKSAIPGREVPGQRSSGGESELQGSALGPARNRGRPVETNAALRRCSASKPGSTLPKYNDALRGCLNTVKGPSGCVVPLPGFSIGGPSRALKSYGKLPLSAL